MNDGQLEAGRSEHAVGREHIVDEWPYLRPETFDRQWQAALAGGPSHMGQQVKLALAASLRHASDAFLPASPVLSAPVSSREAGLLTLAGMAAHLSFDERTALHKETQSLPNLAHRVRGLLLLAPTMPPEMQPHILQEVHEVSDAIEPPEARVRLLLTLLSLMQHAVGAVPASGLVAEALMAARNMRDPEARLRGLAAVAPHLASSVRSGVLHEALDAVDELIGYESKVGALAALAHLLEGDVHERAVRTAERIPVPASRARVLTALASFAAPDQQNKMRVAALDAIEAIVGEADRAAALAAFAPHLEAVGEDAEVFPLLLERALSIAVRMRHREARAVAMVGLDARLPRNLQVEALAAVNSIEDENRRAQLLVELAPSLPEAMVSEVLQAVHEMRRRDARFLALRALSTRLPERMAMQVSRDALSAANALRRRLERALALADLVPDLPSELRHPALSNALAAMRVLEKEPARVRALAAFAPMLTTYPQLAHDALADAESLQDPVEKVNALVALLPCLTKDAAFGSMVKLVLETLQTIKVEHRRSRALCSLAPHLTGEAHEQGVRLARELEDAYERATTMLALYRSADQANKDRLLEEALESAQVVGDPYDRTYALVALCPFLPDEWCQSVISDAFDAVLEVSDEYDRASGLTVFVPLLNNHREDAGPPPGGQVLREAVLAACEVDAVVERGDLLARLVPFWTETLTDIAASYDLWCEALHVLSGRALFHLLSDLVALKPVLAALGGAEAMKTAVQAIRQARQWD